MKSSSYIKPRTIRVTLAFVFVLSAILTGTTRAGEATPQVPKDTLITLERTVCYGTCPSYKLAISADGAVVFEGRRFVKTLGAAETRISQEQLRELIQKFEKINYFGLRNRYQDPQDGCDAFVTDNPSAITSIRINGKTKSVRHYYGCTGLQAVDDLTALEKAIDDSVNADQWIR